MKIPVELKRKYLNRREQELKLLIDSLSLNDFSTALRVGHQVKGSAKTFEFPSMAFLGIELELAAKRRDKVKIHQLAQLLSRQIKLAQNLIS